jgi:hypothetical protein
MPTMEFDVSHALGVCRVSTSEVSSNRGNFGSILFVLGSRD